MIGKGDAQCESVCWHLKCMQALLWVFVFNLTLEATDVSDSEIICEISELMSYCSVSEDVSFFCVRMTFF